MSGVEGGSQDSWNTLFSGAAFGYSLLPLQLLSEKSDLPFLLDAISGSSGSYFFKHLCAVLFPSANGD